MRVRIKTGKYYLLDGARVLGIFDSEEEAYASLYKDRVDVEKAPEAEVFPEEVPEDLDFGEPFERQVADDSEET